MKSKIEYVPYKPEYYDQVINVMRKRFFKDESVCIGSCIPDNMEAQRDLEGLCYDALNKSDISFVARDVEKNLIVGVMINVIQNRQPESEEKSYFERYRDDCCKTMEAKSLMSYMIEADSKLDVFERFNVSSLIELMFLAVLKEYGGQGIGLELCRLSLDVAKHKRIPLATSLFTGLNSQAIGRKLGFEVAFEESFNNYSFNGKTFAERNKLPDLKTQLCAKIIELPSKF